jgi:hypothetical protein
MSVSSQRGHIAWAIQNGKFGNSTNVATGSDPQNLKTSWQRHRAEQVTLGVNDLYDMLPLEVGGSLFVNSSYKNGAFVAGGARIYSRLQGTIGYLIHGVAGQKVTQVTGSATGSSKTAYKTRFQVNPSDETQMPWMSFRKFTPASQGATGLTEYFMDCRVNMLTMAVPAMGPVQMEFSVIGRKPEADDGETTTAASLADDIAFENGTGLAHGCKGLITLEDFEGSGKPLGTAGGKFTSAQIMIANNISQPDQQMVIGSYHPDDLVPLSRAVQIRMIYKWEDPKLYKQLYYNGGSGANIQWSPVVGNSPVSVKSTSVSNIGEGYSEPYSFEFVAGDVDWTMSPPQLAGNNLLFCEFTGVVKGGNSSDPTWYVDLVNASSYTDI